jgi:type I restriction enzyme M protein
MADSVTLNSSSAMEGLEAKLWAAADALRNNMDAAEYKHVVLGLIFLKYISDAFEAKRAELMGLSSEGADPEDPDEYRAENIFWVPKEGRWSVLKDNAPQPTIGKLVDDAMTAIERDNPSLQGVLLKDYARPGLDKQRLGQLINLVSNYRPREPGRSIQGHAGACLRILPVSVCQRGGEEGRPVLHPITRRPRAGRDARAL